MTKNYVMVQQALDFSLILQHKNVKFVMDSAKLAKEVKIFALHAGNSN